MSARMQRAIEGWGDTPPEWIIGLVNACDEAGSSQNKIVMKLGVSSALVSQGISNTYPSPLTTLEIRVRAILMPDTLTCPALGTTTTAVCLGWRDQAKELWSANPNKVMMFKACNNCPRFKKEADQ